MKPRSFQIPPPLPGIGSELTPTPQGVIVSGYARGAWEHPWSIVPVFEENEAGKGEWRGYVKPGFVNGRDVYVSMPTNWPDGVVPQGMSGANRDVPLTNDPEPYMVLGGWRNPLLPQGVSASFDGRILAGKPEGYPPALEEYGVKAPARGGDVTQAGALESAPDEERTRELRAVDVVLTQPRIGSRLDIRAGSLADGQSQFIDTAFTNDFVRSTGGRAKLQVLPKFVPSREDDTVRATYGTLLSAGDSQMDQLKIATIWLLSPPGAASEDVPDQTWEPVPQYFVFWNLCHATRVVMPRVANPPLRLNTGLAGGVGDSINDALLAFINDANAEAEAFLSQADIRGRFWSV